MTLTLQQGLEKTKDASKAWKLLLDRRTEVLEARHRYWGLKEEVFVSDRVKDGMVGSGTAKDFGTNICAQIVDSVINGLDVVSIIPTGDDKSLSQRWKDEFDDADGDIEVSRMLESASIDGEAIGSVWEGDLPLTLDITALHILEAGIVFNRTGKKKLFGYHMQHDAELKKYLMFLQYPDGIVKFQTKSDWDVDDLLRVPVDEMEWIPFQEDFRQELQPLSAEESMAEATTVEELVDGYRTVQTAVWPLPNPYQTVMMERLTNRFPKGMPEHYRAYAPQNRHTTLTVTMMAVNMAQGFPARGLLVNEFDEEGGSPVIGALDSTRFFNPGDPHDLTGESQKQREQALLESVRTVGPNELLMLPGSNVFTFDAAPPDGSLKLKEDAATDAAVATAEPLFRLRPTGTVPSGEAYRRTSEPLLAKLRARRKYYGKQLAKLMRLALSILGYVDQRVMINWGQADNLDVIEMWNLVLTKQQAGMSIKESLVQAGQDPEDVDAWIEEKRQLDLEMAGREQAVAEAKSGTSKEAPGAANADKEKKSDTLKV